MKELQERLNKLVVEREDKKKKYELAKNYNLELEEKKIDLVAIEKEFKQINKKIKEIATLMQIKSRDKKEKEQSQFEEFPQEIKDLMHQAKLNYVAQIENIKKEYYLIKNLQKTSQGEK